MGIGSRRVHRRGWREPNGSDLALSSPPMAELDKRLHNTEATSYLRQPRSPCDPRDIPLLQAERMAERIRTEGS